MKQRVLGTFAITSLAIVGAAAGSAAWREQPSKQEAIQQAIDLSTGFKEIAAAIKPSVVTIRSTVRGELPGRLGGSLQEERFRDFMGDELFRRFFGDLPRQEQGPTRRFERTGFGSGVVVREDGYILTNNHVVEGADEVMVTLSDGRELKAEVVGTDPQTDLAVVRVEASGLTAAEFGDSDAAEVGDWVVAVGNPLNLNYTVTVGIVSAKGRAAVGVADYEDFIQTDAAINPGNSGGPLVNMRGQVIGINTAIATRTGGFQGVGFAIPTNMARRVMESLIEDGTVERGWLGVVIQDLSADLAESFGFEGTDGVLVSDVTEGGPADKAGLESGDIITRIGDRRTTNMSQLRNAVAGTKPGTKVELEFVRNGQRRTETVTLGELEPTTVAAAGRRGTDDSAGHAPAALGLSVQNLTPELARRVGVDAAEGVLVTAVEPGSAAARARIQPGDVIVEVGGEPVSAVGAFRSALASQDLEKGVRMVVLTQGQRRFVFLRKN